MSINEQRRLEFRDWLREVDAALINICGLSHNGIADQTWWDWFDSDMSPEEAATEALENEGFPFD